MEKSKQKLDIIYKWLIDKCFLIDQTSSDSIYVTANSSTDYSVRLLVAIKTEDYEFDKDQLMIKAYKSDRKIWIANVDIEKKSIDWEYL